MLRQLADADYLERRNATWPGETDDEWTTTISGGALTMASFLKPMPRARADGLPDRKIADRFDLTLECIRRHYVGEPSPLTDVLARYTNFFDLFEDFGGYVNFFLLDDLVDQDYSRVRFFLSFDDFQTPGVPTDAAAYREYARLSIEFIRARNLRIDGWCSAT